MCAQFSGADRGKTRQLREQFSLRGLVILLTVDETSGVDPQLTVASVSYQETQFNLSHGDFPGLISCANAPTPRGQVNGSGYGEWNGDAHYELARGWNLALGVYNLLNKKADTMQYWYVDRLQGEPAYGTADLHVHPLEPISLRLTINKVF